MIFVYETSFNTKTSRNSRSGEKPNDGFNNNPVESYNLRSMLTNFENATEVYAQLNSPPPFLSKVRFKPTDKDCFSSNITFFIQTANQVDQKKFHVSSWF